MQEEIKNILKCLEMDMLDNKQIEILLDYITNLQEENKDLKIDNKRLQHNEKVFKSRNEKAIEYIGNGNLGIPRKTRNKFIAILKGKDYNKVERAYLDDEWIGEDKDE